MKFVLLLTLFLGIALSSFAQIPPAKPAPKPAAPVAAPKPAAPAATNAAPSPVLAQSPASLVTPAKGRYGFFSIGAYNKMLIVGRQKPKKGENPVVLTPFSPLPSEIIFDYEIEVYDEKYTRLRSFPIEFGTNRPLRETFQLVDSTIHVIYTLQEKDKNLKLLLSVYSLTGEKLLSDVPLDELDTRGKNTEKGLPIIAYMFGAGLFMKADRGLSDGVFYWEFSPDTSKLLLYKQDVKTNEILLKFLDYKKRKQIWSGTYTIPAELKKADITSVNVNRSGMIVFTITYIVGNTKYITFKLYNPNTRQSADVQTEFTDNEVISSPNVLIDKKDNFIVTGMYNWKKKPKDVKKLYPTEGLFFISINGKTGSNYAFKKHNLKTLNEATKSTIPFTIVYSLLTSGGDVILGTEEYQQTTTTYYSAQGGSSGSSNWGYSNRLVVWRLTATGDVVWQSTLNKKTDANFMSRIGSVITSRDEYLCVLFNENKVNVGQGDYSKLKGSIAMQFSGTRYRV
jgi:hypothetical protein